MVFQRTIKTGVFLLTFGLILSAASAWYEVRAHGINTQPVPQIGTLGQPVVRQHQNEYYIASSMAVRLFTMGAILIVGGLFQFQRAHTHQRIARLEEELAMWRNRAGMTTS